MYKATPKTLNRLAKSRDITNDSRVSMTVSSPPGSMKSYKSNYNVSDTSSPFVKNLKGYSLIIFGIFLIVITIFNSLFGMFKDTIVFHYVINLGPYLVSCSVLFFGVEIGLKLFKHN